jgi:hypothetical protein
MLQQRPDVRADVDHIGELEELPQPYRVCGDDNLPHPTIMSRRQVQLFDVAETAQASLDCLCPRVRSDANSSPAVDRVAKERANLMPDR